MILLKICEAAVEPLLLKAETLKPQKAVLSFRLNVVPEAKKLTC